MPKISGGILVYRKKNKRIEFLLGHPGGPFWARKDLGSWSIPKGLVEDGEDDLETALREFKEETGFKVNKNKLVKLDEIKQKSGKIICIWLSESDLNLSKFRSNTFNLEWPSKSGKFQDFPEIDRVEYFMVEHAVTKIHPGQLGFIEQAINIVGEKYVKLEQRELF